MANLKFILFTLLLFIISIEVNAQRIGNKNAYVAYNRLPDKPLPASYTTYSASVRTKYDVLSLSGFSSNNLIKKYFVLRAFKMLPEGGHFHINATVDRFKVESLQPKTHEKTKKDKEGNKKKVTQYTREIVYRMPITMTIEDKDGNVLEQILYNNPNGGLRHTFLKNNGSKFDSLEEMNKAWKKGAATFRAIRKEAIEKAFSEFSTLIKDKYDTQEAQALVQLKVPKGKKVQGASQFESQASKAARILKRIRANVPLGSAKNNLQPMLNFWNHQKDNYSASHKKEGKIHHACLYNLAIVNYHLDNFEEAERYAEAAVATKQKKIITRDLLKEIKQMKRKTRAQGISTLHFPINLSTATGPTGVNYTHLSQFK